MLQQSDTETLLSTLAESAGYLTLAQFTLFWGIVFLVTTTCIAVFMKERNKSLEPTPDNEAPEELELGIVEAYKTLWKILRVPMVPVLILVFFTTAFPFSAAEDISNLKLIEFGVPGEKIAQLSLPMIPVKFIITFLITKFIVGPRPIMVYLWAYPFRLLMCLALTALVYVTPLMKAEDDTFPGYYYPYLNQMHYLSPIVWIQLRNITPGVIIQVRCKAWARNIQHDDLNPRVGGMHFEIMMD